MTDTREYRFNVTCLQAGQQQPYGDSYYTFDVETDQCERAVERFCTRFLHPCRQSYKEWKEGDAASYFAGYYTFEKTGANKYHYCVVVPFCG